MNMNQNISNKNDDFNLDDSLRHISTLKNFAIAGSVVAGIIITAYIINFFGGAISNNPENWGQLGDYVGGLLNPTFSLLALLALLTTLKLQIKELKLSVNELRNSALALKSQNETLRLQTFEGTFFQTLRLHNEIISNLKIGEREAKVCLDFLLNELHGELLTNNAMNDYERFKIIYDNFYERYQAQLGHYFRLLYNLIKLIKRTENIDQRFYTNLVRAQLSSSEVKLIFFNCLSDVGNEKFKPLIEEFSLLKTMPYGRWEIDEILYKYDVTAFGGKYPTKSFSG